MNACFVRPVKRPLARMRLFCFPYAGGSAAIYAGWEKQLPHFVELYAIQAPGRANRIAEDPYQNMDDLVDELAKHITGLLDLPFIFFGHSLGSRVAIELMSRLRERKLPLPMHFIASGSRGPHKKIRESDFHRLNDDEFVERIKSLEGTPQEILEDKDLLALFLPLLRADFKIAGEYQYKGQEKFNCRLTVLGGQEDAGVERNDLFAWQNHFTSDCQLKQYPGGHFFIKTKQDEVLEDIKHILNEEEKHLHYMTT